MYQKQSMHLKKMELGTIQAALYHFDTPCGFCCKKKKQNKPNRKKNAYVW